MGYTGPGWVTGSHNNAWNYELLSAPNERGLYLDISGLQTPMSVDPLFTDRPNGDYTLASGSPLIDAGLDVGLPFVGDAPDIGAYENSVISIPDQLDGLAESFQEISPDSFKNAGEKRSHALNKKLMAVMRQLSGIKEDLPTVEKIASYTAMKNKLSKDILAKMDGYHGGNPKNDWVTDQEEQDYLYPEVVEIIDAVQAEINALTP